jgi:Ni2+-binding GTPase involved in maturation of urease and hydrogenase
LYEFAGVEVRTTFKPSQKAVSPLAVITGTTGSGKTNCLDKLIPQIRSQGQKAVIVDMKYSIKTQYTMIQQMGTASTANVRIYVNNKPWHDNVASTNGDNIIVLAELAKISDNYGFIYTEAPRTGRYIAVWRDSSEPFLDICKVIV